MPKWLVDIFSSIINHWPLAISFPYYDTDLAPFYSRFWATFAHFDGIHYLRIAAHGYADWGSQAFFPLYPLLLRALSPLTPTPLVAGLLISWLSFFLAILGLKKLFPDRPQLFWLILAFPSAFFFFTLYTESLFFSLSIWFFVFQTKQKWWLAALLACLASATRLVGVFLSLSLLIELLHRPLSIIHRSFLVLISISGLLAYMYYLFQTTGDPLLFFHVQPVFGGGRSGGELILLPQVIYRYAKILLTTSYDTFVFWRSFLELGFLTWALSSIIKKFKSIPLSANFYLILSVILPTLSGSLSSLPRYLLVLTPWLLPESKRGILLYLALAIPLSVLLILQFARGIFVS